MSEYSSTSNWEGAKSKSTYHGFLVRKSLCQIGIRANRLNWKTVFGRLDIFFTNKKNSSFY